MYSQQTRVFFVFLLIGQYAETCAFTPVSSPKMGQRVIIRQGLEAAIASAVTPSESGL